MFPGGWRAESRKVSMSGAYMMFGHEYDESIGGGCIGHVQRGFALAIIEISWDQRNLGEKLDIHDVCKGVEISKLL